MKKDNRDDYINKFKPSDQKQIKILKKIEIKTKPTPKLTTKTLKKPIKNDKYF